MSRRRLPLLIVSAASIFYALAWFTMGVWRYRVFRASVDGGAATQIVASAFSGFRSANEPFLNHFVVHFSPIFYVLAPIVIAAHSSLALTAIQAAAGALVAPPLFLIARKRMPDGYAAACAVVALLYPPLCGVTFTDFFESGLEPAAVLWLIWAIDAGKIALAYVLGIAALGIKEDVAPSVAFGGTIASLWFARHGDRARSQATLVLAIVAALVFVGYFAVLRPLLHAPLPAWDLQYYQAGSATTVTLASRLRFLVSILAPLVGLPLLSPAIVFALPGLLEALLSQNPITMSLETHYSGVWIGYVLLAFVLGAVRVVKFSPRIGALVLLLAAGWSSYVVVSVDPAARWYYLYRPPNAHDTTVQSFIDALPQDSDVGGDEQIFAHLGFYPRASVEITHRFVIVDTTQHDISAVWRSRLRMLDELVRQGRYRAVRSTDGVILYERS